ncbi:probable ATP-dependent RNA helicase DDX49 [Caerostris darwini]|uniref:RNA helicase n=1 Tax=Caerostris darwini TaxID=1538125 RepID=A0AAV4V6C2_9ARAC|nr:probable ATP-dependent RNA helicase DDX49 [Caerostris darwini]
MSTIARDEGFNDLKLEPWLVEQCTAMGITKPTPVQRHCIPQILQGKNCLAISQTGTGKTLAFALPMLHCLSMDLLSLFGLILTPTRELAIQIYEQIKIIGKPIDAEVCLIIGGKDQVHQGGQISQKPHIFVATPGRLADVMQSGYDSYFKRIKFLVLDEADSLLSGSFTDQLEVIVNTIPKKRQTLFFSATMTEMLENGAKNTKNPTFVWKAENQSTVSELKQQYVLVRSATVRSAHLIILINDYQAEHPDNSVIIFTKNCDCCQVVSQALKKLGFENVALNSHMKQRERATALTIFRSNRTKILVATDMASRGLDIPMVDLVINYSVPPDPNNYVHRVGRTARAGRGGLALTLMTPSEINRLMRIEEKIKLKLTEYEVPEKEVLKIALQVDVAFREAAVNLEYDEYEEKKKIYQRKRSILTGEDISPSAKKLKRKKNHKNSIKIKPEVALKDTESTETNQSDIEEEKKKGKC